MSRVIFPTDTTPDTRKPTIFLAGSIEMGKADKWQDRLIYAMRNDDVVFFNPRRPDWDSSWAQVKTDPNFSHQVKWELKHLEDADIIALYLAPGTVSPISLLELGLYLASEKLIICCPEGFDRKGNVDITAERYGVDVWEDFDRFIEAIRERTAELFDYYR